MDMDPTVFFNVASMIQFLNVFLTILLSMIEKFILGYTSMRMLAKLLDHITVLNAERITTQYTHMWFLSVVEKDKS